MIGLGDREDGLYYLRRDDVAVGAVVSGNMSSKLGLWHARLGHPSESVIKLIPCFRNTKVSLLKPCDICHRAKHIRSTYPLSNNKSSIPFELIHCDLWGPYQSSSSNGSNYFLTIVDDCSRSV